MDESGIASTSTIGWSDINTDGNNTVLNAGTYSLAVNNGTKLMLGSISQELLTLALDNIATLRQVNAANMALLPESNTGTDPGTDPGVDPGTDPGTDLGTGEGVPIFALTADQVSFLTDAVILHPGTLQSV